ncbi:hypothetical protein [Streptosporangium roseum]|uniref:Uncharacterized protein n=1 Tax=Streptosporangium roseum (strain ATCC 12428 / DSM 43021 / JCM 3005 / KCTC 9067 / NCIMB 10171 / NRRL 2505 / NI 9100) TaxID=479432 RepID=D2BCV0_STRRD|nr:hypothetical protein [Streptosporangium roseum]ACZ91920.1 hypothetical protein Sros_9302 [Streptosporangium roseum DSM 43021]
MAADLGEVKDGWRIAGLVVRIALLLILLSGALVTALSFAPSQRTLGEFRAAVAAGRVSAITYRTGGEKRQLYELRWSEGPLAWHGIGTVPVRDGPRSYTVAEFTRDIAGVSADVTQLRGHSGDGGIIPDWPFQMPVRGWAVWTGVAWSVTSLIMLASVPRLGNRWAWFWLFTVGQVGAIVFLLLEPRPLWSGAGERPVPRGRLTGAQGCLVSIGLGLLAVAGATGVGRLAGLVLG